MMYRLAHRLAEKIKFSASSLNLCAPKKLTQITVLTSNKDEVEIQYDRYST